MSAVRGRVSRLGPLAGLIAQLLLLAVLVGFAGLSPLGEVVGVLCAVTMAAALARGLAHRERLGPASWVTLARATLASRNHTFDRATPIGPGYDADGAPAPPRDGLSAIGDLTDLFAFDGGDRDQRSSG